MGHEYKKYFLSTHHPSCMCMVALMGVGVVQCCTRIKNHTTPMPIYSSWFKKIKKTKNQQLPTKSNTCPTLVHGYSFWN